MSLEDLKTKLVDLEDAYYSGVLKVREGDTWVEYNSMSQMRIAIDKLELRIANFGKASRPMGTRLVRVGKGYR